MGLDKIWEVSLSSSLLVHPCWFFYSICSLSCRVFNNLHQLVLETPRLFLTCLSSSLVFKHFRPATPVLIQNNVKAYFDFWKRYRDTANKRGAGVPGRRIKG